MGGLVEKMVRTIKRYDMAVPGDTVLCAVSGGPDSMAMLHALFTVSRELGIRIAVAHMDHGLRPDSGNDAAFVKEYAERLGLRCVVREARLGEVISKGDNVQEAAREARYLFLQETADELGAARIAAGHTMDDQAETYLMRVIRGAGTQGLSGMPRVRGRVIRPLIEVSRAEVMEYIDENSVGYVTDPTNLKTKYTRNRVRLELLPALMDYNPEIIPTLARAADIMRDEDDCLDAHASELLDTLVMSDTGWAVTLDGERWRGTHTAVKRRILRQIFGRLKGDTLGLGYGHVEDALDILDAGHTGAGVDMPGGVRVETSYGNPVVYRPDAVPSGWSVELSVPGTTEVPELGIVFEAEMVPGGIPYTGRDGMTAYLDASKVKGPLVARGREPGDRIRPLGMDGSKKLKELFIDMKMPRLERETTPVLTCGGEIAWVVGVRQDGRFAATTGTGDVLVVRVIKQNAANNR